MKKKWGMMSVALLCILGGLILALYFQYPFPALLLIILGSAALLAQKFFTQLPKQNAEKKESQAEALDKNFLAVFANPTIGMALVSLEDQLIKVNPALCQMLGFSESELIHGHFSRLLRSENFTNYQFYSRELLDNKLHTFHKEIQFTHKNGEPLWAILNLSLVRDDHNQPLYFVVQLQNITLQKKTEEKMLHMAYRDPLTDLANRNKLEQFVNQLIAMARRHQQQFALFFLDLDRFKNINDTIGHNAGDILLQIVAERLKSSVRNTDLVARVSGDEFVLAITDVKKTEAVAVIAQKILNTMLKVMVINNHEIYITVSIGISLYPYDGQTMNVLMKNADLAMYRAKEQGGNNYQFYTFEMTTKAKQKMALLNALGHALVKNEFMLHYQPKLDVPSKTISGVEALLRWQSQQYRMITPNEIISLAEETGLIIPVSEWILNTAFKQVKQWREMGFNLSIAINCSIRQLNQANHVETILRMLNDNGLLPSSLELEITEGIIMDDPENMAHVLYSLKDLGVQIAIDDFGMGYWSLNNLRRFSIDKIKIDRSFVSRIPADEKCVTIVTAIIAMANKLGIRVVAEGVETQEQYQFLIDEGCAEIQGYYLCQPLPGEIITEFLQDPKARSELLQQQELVK